MNFLRAYSTKCFKIKYDESGSIQPANKQDDFLLILLSVIHFFLLLGNKLMTPG